MSAQNSAASGETESWSNVSHGGRAVDWTPSDQLTKYPKYPKSNYFNSDAKNPHRNHIHVALPGSAPPPIVWSFESEIDTDFDIDRDINRFLMRNVAVDRRSVQVPMQILVAMLEAAGGSIILDQDDVDNIKGEVEMVMQYDPPRWIIRIKEDTE